MSKTRASEENAFINLATNRNRLQAEQMTGDMFPGD